MICPTGQAFLSGLAYVARLQATPDNVGADPRLAKSLKGPLLRRIVAVERAQLVVRRWRRKLVRILRGDTHQRGQPAEKPRPAASRDDGRCESHRSANQKARGRFPGAGFGPCDALNVLVICPTCQLFSARGLFVHATYSKP